MSAWRQERSFHNRLRRFDRAAERERLCDWERRLENATSCLPAPFWRNKITLVTHRCHILHMIRWRDCESSIVELADVPN
jgi:hypothetical protein